MRGGIFMQRCMKAVSGHAALRKMRPETEITAAGTAFFSYYIKQDVFPKYQRKYEHFKQKTGFRKKRFRRKDFCMFRPRNIQRDTTINIRGFALQLLYKPPMIVPCA